MPAAEPTVRAATAPLAAAPAGGAAPARPRGRGVLGLRWIVAAGTIAIVSAAVISIGLVSERSARAALNREMQTRLVLHARNLALTSSGALLGDFPELTLQPVVRELLAEERELVSAVVVDHAGRVAAHPDAHRLGAAHAMPAGLRPVPPAAALAAGESLRASAKELLAFAPVRGPGGRVIGTAVVGMRRDHVVRALAATRRRQALLMAAFVLLGALGAFTLVSSLLRPIATLREGLRRIGRGDLSTRIPPAGRTELGLLAEAVNEMTEALAAAQAVLLERERLSHEVDLAREIQESLLPAEPWRGGRWVVAGHQHAAAEVGGDYYDVLPLADGRIAVAIADVAGKGLAGCLVMSMLSALLRALRDAHPSPASLLAALDERLGDTLQPGVFVTMSYGILDPSSGRLVVAGAGHNPLLVFRRARGEVEVHRSRGIPLGAIRGGAIRPTLHDEEIVLAPGDLAVQYTDGYSEAFDRGGTEEFGLGRIVEVVAAHGARGQEAVIAALRAQVAEWSAGVADDDQTLLVVEALAGAGEEAGAAADGAPASEAEALELVARAEREGRRLLLPARLDALAQVRDWLDQLPELAGLRGAESEWLASALYEACANVAEHALANDPARSFELWWVPRAPAERARAAPAGSAWSAREGLFLLRDEGGTFRPEGWKASDFTDPDVRRRGRGIGLDIIHRVMRRVRYFPATARGNITVLAFGPDVPEAAGAPSHE